MLTSRTSHEAMKSLPNSGGTNSKWERKWREMVSNRNRAQLARRYVRQILESRMPVEGKKEAFQVILKKSQIQPITKESKIKQVKIHLQNVAIRQREIILELEELREREQELLPSVEDFTTLLKKMFPPVARLAKEEIQDPRMYEEFHPESILEYARHFCETSHLGTKGVLKWLLRTTKRRSELLTTLIELDTSMKCMMENLNVERIKGNPFIPNYLTYLIENMTWFPYAYALISNSTSATLRQRGKSSSVSLDKTHNNPSTLINGDQIKSKKKTNKPVNPVLRDFDKQYKDISLKSLLQNSCQKTSPEELIAQSTTDHGVTKKLPILESQTTSTTGHDSDKIIQGTKMKNSPLYFDDNEDVTSIYKNNSFQMFPQSLNASLLPNETQKTSKIPHLISGVTSRSNNSLMSEEMTCASRSHLPIAYKNHTINSVNSLDTLQAQYIYRTPQMSTLGKIVNMAKPSVIRYPHVLLDAPTPMESYHCYNQEGSQLVERGSNDRYNVVSTQVVQDRPSISQWGEHFYNKDGKLPPVLQNLNNSNAKLIEDTRVRQEDRCQVVPSGKNQNQSNDYSHVYPPSYAPTYTPQYTPAFPLRSEEITTEVPRGNKPLHTPQQLTPRFQTQMQGVIRVSPQYDTFGETRDFSPFDAQYSLAKVSTTTLPEQQGIHCEAHPAHYPHQLYLQKVRSTVQQEQPKSAGGIGCSFFPKTLKTRKRTPPPSPSSTFFSFFSKHPDQPGSGRKCRFYCSS